MRYGEGDKSCTKFHTDEAEGMNITISISLSAQ